MKRFFWLKQKRGCQQNFSNKKISKNASIRSNYREREREREKRERERKKTRKTLIFSPGLSWKTFFLLTFFYFQCKSLIFFERTEFLAEIWSLERYLILPYLGRVFFYHFACSFDIRFFKSSFLEKSRILYKNTLLVIIGYRNKHFWSISAFYSTRWNMLFIFYKYFIIIIIAILVM